MIGTWRRAAGTGFVCWVLAMGSAQAAPASVPPAVVQEMARANELLDQWYGNHEHLLQARAIVDRVLREHPDHAPAYRVQARVLLSEGYRYGRVYDPGTVEAALRSVAKAVSLTPDDPENYLLRARLQRLEDQWEASEASLAKAEQTGADPVWLDFQRGEWFSDQRRYEEAAVHYQKVLASPKATKRQRDDANDGLLPYYNVSGRLDDAERVQRAQMKDNPDSAWLRGNYANWLMCWREDVEAALVEVRKARAMMDYGRARLTETAALYDRWSAQVLAGHDAQAAQTWQQARALRADASEDGDPAYVLSETCGGPVVRRALQAMRVSGQGQRLPPVVAVMMAAERAPAAVPGIFVMQVQASGRSGKGLYLNSEPDYRDQRNLSVHLLPKAQDELRRKYRQEPDALFKGMVIQVLGYAQRTKIDFMANGQPTGAFYYQTHVLVDSADNIDVLENRPAR